MGVGPGFTPIRVVLDAASSPSYAIGNLLRGRGDQALLNILSAGQAGDKTFVSSTPVAQAGIRRIPGPSWVRSGTGLALDIATDPLTYVTFGVGGAAKGTAGAAARAAEKAAAQKLADATLRAVAEGRRMPSAREVAEIAVEKAMATRAAPRTLKVNVRTPFTRGQTRLVAESRLAARAVETSIRPLRDGRVGVALRRIFRADQGVDPALYEGRRAVRYWGESTQRVIRQSIDRERKYAKQMGVDSERITYHLDQPVKYPARNAAEAEVFERAAGLRDEIEQIARDAGVEMGFVQNYVMHLPKTPKDARAFEKMYGAKPENAGYTKQRPLATLDDWHAHGLTPELDVWKLMDVRAGQGIRDAAIKGYMDMAAGRGVKPPPLRPVDVGGQAIKVSQLESDLHTSMQKVSTKAERKAQKQAQAAVKFAQRALRVANESKDPAAIARAERALAQAEEAARPAAILGAPAQAAEGTVGDVLSSSLEEVGTLARSRGARAARLPEPTAGRYAVTADPADTPRRLASRARALKSQALKARTSAAADLRALAKERRDTYKPSLQSTQTQVSPRGPGLSHGHSQNIDSNQGRVKFNAGNENSGVHYRSKAEGGGRKNLSDYERDILGELDDQVARYGIDSLSPAERRIFDANQAALDLEHQAEQIATALRQSEGGAFGELDAASGAARVEELAADLPASRVNMRARRERGAARHGAQETPRVARNAGPDGPVKPTSKAARAKFARYFNSTGPLTEAIAAVKLGAETEVKAATRAAQRQVTLARRAYEMARRGSDEEAIRFARRMLADAQRTERAVSAELARAKATYGAKPREVAAKVRELIVEQRKLVKMEQQARKVAEHNKQLAERPGLATSSYEEYRAIVEEGWLKHTSKYHKDTLLDPDTAEAVRMVDLETARLIGNDPDIQAFARFFNSMGSSWKSLQLVTPRYHLRNLMDDGLADWLAGARNPKSYVDAARILRGTYKGTIKTKAGTFTPEQILMMAESQGALHMGYAAWEVGKQQERGLVWRGLSVRAPGSGRVAQTSRHIGEIREDWTRLGLFLEMLKKGEDPVKAGMTVRRYRYDYSDMAPALMKARAVAIPFLTFTWKTIPMLGKQLAERPGTFSHINAVQEFLQETGGDPDRSLLAPWERAAFGVPAPDAVKGVFGAAPGEPVFYNPERTFRYGAFNMLDPRPESIVRNWLGSVGPIKVPVEAITGYSTFQARQLRPGERVREPLPIEIARNLGVPIAGAGPKTDSYTGEQVPGYSARLHNILSLFPPFSQFSGVAPSSGNTGWQSKLAKYGTGLDLRPEQRARSTYFAEKFGGK